MALELLAIDLGKRSFHLYGIDTDGVILSRKVSRAKLAEVVGNLAPTVIAMEACASAHYWARCWLAAGREVRLINPRFVKPFVKGSKNDAVDAEAIFEAATRPTMRFVPVKSTDQQDLQSLHRARDRLICQRTALINHTRGLLAEYGVVLPKGPGRFMAQAPSSIAGADLSHLARAIFGELMDQLDDLDRRIQKLDAMIVTLCRTNETCRRLAKLPGAGPIIATAIAPGCHAAAAGTASRACCAADRDRSAGVRASARGDTRRIATPAQWRSFAGLAANGPTGRWR